MLFPIIRKDIQERTASIFPAPRGVALPRPRIRHRRILFARHRRPGGKTRLEQRRRPPGHNVYGAKEGFFLAILKAILVSFFIGTFLSMGGWVPLAESTLSAVMMATLRKVARNSHPSPFLLSAPYATSWARWPSPRFTWEQGCEYAPARCGARRLYRHLYRGHLRHLAKAKSVHVGDRGPLED